MLGNEQNVDSECGSRNPRTRNRNERGTRNPTWNPEPGTRNQQPLPPARLAPMFHRKAVLAAAVLCTGLAGTACRSPRPGPSADWPTHGGDPGPSAVFVARPDQHRRTSRRLKVAWTLPHARRATGQPLADPVQPHRRPRRALRHVRRRLKTFALDAATGRQLWVFDPFAAADAAPVRSASTAASCSGRAATNAASWSRRGPAPLRARRAHRHADPHVRANGQRLAAGRARARRQQAVCACRTRPAAIYKDLLILGTRVSEGPGPAAPGHIRAYDVRTGKIRWMFHTIPLARRLRLRHVAAGRLDAHRRRQRLERHQRGRRARTRLPADRIGRLRFLGRQPAGREPLCQLPARARGRTPASGCGTTSWCTTTSGIAIRRPHPCS